MRSGHWRVPTCERCASSFALPRAVVRTAVRTKIRSGTARFQSTLAGAVPTAAGIAERLEAAVRDRDRVLELDEAAPWMLHRRLDRNHHAAFERAIRIVTAVCAIGGEPRRFMADQSHAVGDEIEIAAMRGGAHELFGGNKNIAAARPLADRPARRLLNCIDRREQILQLRIRIAQNAHPAKVADIAAII